LTEKDFAEKNNLIDTALSVSWINYYQLLGIGEDEFGNRASLENQIRRLQKRFERESVQHYFQYQFRYIPTGLLAHLRKIEATLLDPEQKNEYDRFLAEGKSGDFSRDSEFKKAEEEIELAKELENKGNYKEALKHVQNAISLNKKKGRYYAQLGELLYRAGKPDDVQILQKVEQCYKIAINLSEPREACIYLCKLSDIYREREQYALANSLLRKAIKLNPNSNDAIMRMNVYLKEDKQSTYIKSIFQNLGELNYFQILNISSEPSLREIREGFLKRARAFHPDLFLQADPDTQLMVDRIFKKTVEAYVSLRTPKHRVEQSEMARLNIREFKEPKVSMPKMARTFYDRAMMALTRGDQSNAKFNLKLALSLAPKNEELLNAMEGLE
jgi:tetratricopeptide (TPR) repeat protein